MPTVDQDIIDLFQLQLDDKLPKIQQSAILGRYLVQRSMGAGTFGQVVLARDTGSGEEVALKFIDRERIPTSQDRRNLDREIRLMKILHHPNIIRVLDLVEDPRFVIIVMELAAGGELYNHVMVKQGLGEREARHYFRQIVSALEYCHQSSVVHRDLKPENLLLDGKGGIKLSDFGFGNTYGQDTCLATFCGSPLYAAPEMTQGIEYYGPEVDVWSLGVVLYMMVTATLPFRGDNIRELYRSIAQGKYADMNTSPELANLVSQMLQVDPAKRASLTWIRNHPWTVGTLGKVSCWIPPRQSVIERLDEQVLQWLEPLGYHRSDYFRAFSAPYQKGPIKSMYHLHSEALRRKQNQDLWEESREGV